MSKYLVIGFIIAIFGMIFTYQNCAVPKDQQKLIGSNNEPVSFTGTVKTLDLENCGKVIVSDEDKTSTFIPMGVDLKDVPEKSQVQITGKVAEDMVSTCMVGVILKVDKITVVGGAAVKPTAKTDRLPSDESETVVY